jgi:hypothetical protein
MKNLVYIIPDEKQVHIIPDKRPVYIIPDEQQDCLTVVKGFPRGPPDLHMRQLGTSLAYIHSTSSFQLYHCLRSHRRLLAYAVHTLLTLL